MELRDYQFWLLPGCLLLPSSLFLSPSLPSRSQHWVQTSNAESIGLAVFYCDLVATRTICLTVSYPINNAMFCYWYLTSDFGLEFKHFTFCIQRLLLLYLVLQNICMGWNLAPNCEHLLTYVSGQWNCSPVTFSKSRCMHLVS